MAADPRIILYIRQQMDAGFRKSQIYDALLQAGWYKEEVDEAFYQVASQPFSKLEPDHVPFQETFDLTKGRLKAGESPSFQNLPERPGFFWKLRNALFHPRRLFEAVRDEKGITKALGFFGALYFINFTVTIAVLLSAPYLLESFARNPILQEIIRYILSISLVGLLNPITLLVNYVIMFALTLLGAAIIHLFIYVLGGRGGFHQTYKALMYSTAPLLALVLVFPIFLLGSAFDLDYILMFLIPACLFIAIGFWSVMIAVKGLSSLHKISALKSVTAVVIIPLLITVALSFVVFMFLSSILIGIFSPYPDGVGSATGFGELGLPSEWQYSYNGSFYISLRNRAAAPITINTVTANCGTGGSIVILETLEPVHLESGGEIRYSSGDERCALKEPGESYSVSVTVRYLKGTSLIEAVSGTVTGRVA